MIFGFKNEMFKQKLPFSVAMITVTQVAVLSRKLVGRRLFLGFISFG